ncbi:AAA domain-domain-containing protein [Catenaria anguillulae PL171]|uniref:AAA domain-domain-containing protein n=1 Tax=Catenaria anguillulae PL171 TaxID=765915 RepID=A0A1Y2HN76_9FUNG|nr:AAA domain-domain-containing protein [Catenaria anguillulae PL171]
MNEEITELVNAATYHGRLTCGSEKVANQRLELPRGVPQGTPGWIRHALIGPSVVFLNVPSGKETAVAATKGIHGGLINNVQVEMVKQLAASMVLAGVQGEDIGVITPYRAQLARIRAALDAAAAGEIECCTIDQYQGRDKTVIVVSLVRCNSQGQTGDLLRDWKRINVAMTRARCKLILIGCAETLRHSLLWATALNTIEGRGWKVTVDPKLS